MKKILRLCLVLVMLASLTVSASADLIWAPDNSFFRSHADECTHLEGGKYFVNSEDGFITLWSRPDGGWVVGQVSNGVQTAVSWLYKDWTCITVMSDEGRIEGWVAMKDLSKVYDYLAFEAEYADRITPYNGEFADYDGEDLYGTFFEYPGAPEVKHRVEMKAQDGTVRDSLTGSRDGNSAISSIFVDENGLTWGYVGYLNGKLQGWFCLDDPDGTEFPLREVVQDELIQPQTPSMPARAYESYVVVAIVVIAVVVVTILLLRRYRKKK